MEIGFSQVPINPPLPAYLGGYGDRKSPAVGTHDDIYGKCWVFRSDKDSFALVVADLLGLDRGQVRAVRKRAAELTGIAPDRVFVGVTHTHSAPITVDVPGSPANPVYTTWLLETLAGAVYTAYSNMRRGKTGLGVTEVHGIGMNRRDPRKPLDSALTALCWYEGMAASCVPTGVFASFGCHPTVMGPDNLLISADYPGEMTRALRRLLGSGLSVLFANGAAGDVSTRFTRRGQTWDELSRLGCLLAAHVAEIAMAPRSFMEEPEIGVVSRSIELPAKKIPSAAAARDRVEEYRRVYQLAVEKRASHAELRVAKTRLEGALRELAAQKLSDRFEREAEIVAAKVGELGIVMVPGELFSSLGKRIREASPFPYNMVLSYMNGYVGYIPDREAYDEGGYEALSSHLSPDAGDLTVETAVKLLGQLHRQ